jgi:hypothetical protein
MDRCVLMFNDHRKRGNVRNDGFRSHSTNDGVARSWKCAASATNGGPRSAATAKNHLHRRRRRRRTSP